jgi:hypothetical protein
MTSKGQLAVETTWWIDGWWIHQGQAFDDTAAQGHAVMLTAPGATELLTIIGH